MGSLKAFFATFVSDIFGLISGVASMVLAIIASWAGSADPFLWWPAAYLCGIFSAYRLWMAEFQKPGPQIIIEYETLSRTSPDPANFTEWEQWKTAGGGNESDIPLILKNLSDIPAVKVQVQDLILAGKVARFNMIPTIEKGNPKQVAVTVEPAGPLLVHDFWNFLKDGIEASQSSDDIVLPIIVRYEDIRGREFESPCEIRYNIWTITTVPIPRKWRRIESRPKWLTRLNK